MSIGGSPVAKYPSIKETIDIADRATAPVTESLTVLGRDFGVPDERILGMLTLLSGAFQARGVVDAQVQPWLIVDSIRRQFVLPEGTLFQNGSEE